MMKLMRKSLPKNFVARRYTLVAGAMVDRLQDRHEHAESRVNGTIQKW